MKKVAVRNNMLDITGVNLVKFVKEVYNLSRPQGLGFIHFTPGPLSSNEASLYVRPPGSYIRVSTDYIRGRACKMVVWEESRKLLIRDRWFDHSSEDLDELLRRV